MTDNSNPITVHVVGPVDDIPEDELLERFLADVLEGEAQDFLASLARDNTKEN